MNLFNTENAMPDTITMEKAAVYNPPCGDGKYILTPPEHPAPRINGPAVYGVRPGSPFLFQIPASGLRPMTFAAEQLPTGLMLDEATGIICGTISDQAEQEHRVVLYARNEKGETAKELTIVVGDAICLTPPMGWNSWNCRGPNVSQAQVLASARAMVDKGLANHGWSYINIDDGWQGQRGGKYNAIQPNPEEFSNIGNMCDQIHALGLKVGIYSTPWVATYAGYVGGSSDCPEGTWDAATMGGTLHKRRSWYCGTHAFDENDAAQWADWGIDYLKYDWNPNDPESTLRMADALKRCGRDVVYSLSNSAPIEYAELYVNAVNCWRTTGDLKDRWNQSGSNWNLRDVWNGHRSWMDEGAFGGPGHFPDADMLVVGDVIENNRMEQPRPSRLSADEQYAHISLWVLWSSPLLIGCPIETVDDFTLNLLTNPDVLDIHQDAAAVPGRTVYLKDGIEIVVKSLANGDQAIGVFNVDEAAQVVQLNWQQIGLEGAQEFRDVWRHTDIGIFTDSLSVRVRPHGVVLIRARQAETV
jgi:alpha-galactosidase